MDDYRDMAYGIIQQCSVDGGKACTKSVLNVVSKYISPSSKVYNFMRECLDPNSINPEIDENILSDVFFKCRENLVDLDDPLSNNTTSFELLTSQESKDSIEDLKSKLKDKEHTILRLQNDLERNIQLNEDSITLLVAERDGILNELKSMKSIKDSFHNLSTVKIERDELIEQLEYVHYELADCHAELGNLTKKNMDLESERLRLSDVANATTEELQKIREQLSKRQQQWQRECDDLKERLYIALQRVEEQEEAIGCLRLANEHLHSEMQLMKAEKVDKRVFVYSHWIDYSDDSNDTKLLSIDENDNQRQRLSIYDEFKQSEPSYPDVCQKTDSNFVVMTNDVATQVQCQFETQDSGVQVSCDEISTVEQDYINIRHDGSVATYISKHLLKLQATNRELLSIIKALSESVTEYDIQIKTYYFVLMPASDAFQKWVNETRDNLRFLDGQTTKRSKFIEKILDEVQHSDRIVSKVGADVQTDFEAFNFEKDGTLAVHIPLKPESASKQRMRTLLQTAVPICGVIFLTTSILILYQIACYMYALSRGHNLKVVSSSWLTLDEILSIFFKIEYHGEAPI